MALWVLKENLLLNRFNDIGHNRHIIPFLKRKRIDIEYYKGYEDFERISLLLWKRSILTPLSFAIFTIFLFCAWTLPCFTV